MTCNSFKLAVECLLLNLDLLFILPFMFVICSLIYLHTQEYKPPSSKDIPIDFRVALLKNVPNPVGVLGSKGGVLGSHV